MNYSSKIFYLYNYVNTGMNYSAKDFIRSEYQIAEKNEDYEETIPDESKNYVDRLFMYYRKQLQRTGIRKVQDELNILMSDRIKTINAKRNQLLLF